MLQRSPTAPALACLGTGMMCRDHIEHPETSSSAQGAVRMHMDQRECVGDLK